MNAQPLQRRAADANAKADAILAMERKMQRNYLEAMVHVYHPRTDLADFTDSDLEEILDIDEAERAARRPFDRRVAAIILAAVICAALLLALQGCGGGDPEPDPTIGMERDVHNPHPCIKPVLPPECEDHAPEGTQHTQQWHDQCDGPNT